MAKRKSRAYVGLACVTCGQQNYVTEINKLNTTEPLSLEKFCKKCRSKEKHKMMKKID